MEPTLEPEPTVPGALPLRTEVEVNSPIVDRPGVPSDLYDTYWWSDYGDAGKIGTTAQIGLPANEWILAMASNLVVSARKSTDDGYGRADLFVRDIRSGEVVKEIATTVGDPVATLIGDRLFWAGVDPTSDGVDHVIDGGVWTMPLAPGSVPFAIVPAGEDITSLGSAGRARFKQSPSGATLAATVGGFSGRFTDIIDVKTLKPRTRLDGDAGFALTDDVVLVPDHPPTDYAEGGVIARDIDTGDVLWRFPRTPMKAPFGVINVEALGPRFVVWFQREAGGRDEFVIGTLKPETGELTERLVVGSGDPMAGFTVEWTISTSRLLALTRDSLVEGGPISLLDLDTGTLNPEVFVIDPPWLCYEDYCLRD